MDRVKKRRTGRIGPSFDDFLAEQSMLEECEERAIKQILADQIKANMIPKVALSSLK